jgi:NTE family protein
VSARPRGRAIVLSGGGLAGVAWGCGYLHALEERGVSVRDADLVVGTSAGSLVGAWLTAGRPLSHRYRFLANDGSPVRRGLTSLFGAVSREPDAAGRQALELLLQTEQPTLEEVRELGALARRAQTMPEALYVGFVDVVVGRRDWRGEALKLTAHDTETGDRVVLAAGGRVALGRACAASSAVPGVFPPVKVRGRRLMDGGCRSGSNADLAAGADRALVLVLFPRPGIAEAAWLRDELPRLEAGGTRVLCALPDEAAIAATGSNALDPEVVPHVARAGYEQGIREAEPVASFWQR